jgi:DNA polymerase III epsilon subunit-like protein
LVFDVETTGLLPKSDPAAPPPKIEDYPHIIQFSFILYDTIEHEILQSCDSYVKIPKTVMISKFITDLTGITNDQCEREGKPFLDVLSEFYALYSICDGMIAHNMYFDERMIQVEIERHREQIIKHMPRCLSLFNPMHETIRNMERYCTMRKTIQLCNLPMTGGDGTSRRKKFPKLSELFAKLFEKETLPDNMHSAIIDVFVCLKCYLKIEHNYDFML